MSSNDPVIAEFSTAPHPEDAPWDARTLRDPHAQQDKSRRVEAMFDAIAPTYEKVNAIASLGQDARWRRIAISAAAVQPTDVVLDLCCGTGDMVRAFAALPNPPARIFGVDFSAQMLAAGAYEPGAAPIQLVRADALRLPLSDATVDVVTCAFGVRNFQDLDAGLREIRRILRPGGRVVILEFAPPTNPLIRAGYSLYTNFVLPRLGMLIARDRANAYRYLPRSIQTFATRKEMAAQVAGAGFSDVTTRGLNLGTVVIYRGVVR